MASNVNIKFIAIAGAVLGAVGIGGLWYAYDRLTKTGEESVLLGDEAASKNDWETAMVMYSRAVAKDQGNIEWIEKWITSIRNTKPETSQLYSERYFGGYVLALRARAEAERDQIAPFRKYLDEVHQRIAIFGGDLGSWESHLGHVDEFLKRYTGDAEAGKVLRRYPGMARVRLLQLKSDLNREDMAMAAADLEAAIQADPADEESTVALSTLDMLIAADHRKRNELDLVATREGAARKRIEDFVKAYPPAPDARLALFQIDIGEIARTVEAGVTTAEVFRAQRDRIQQIVDAAFGERKDKLSPRTAIAAAELAETALDSGANVADMLLSQALQGRPNDPQLMLAWGHFELRRGNTEKAVERLQAVVDLPDPPVGLDGVVLLSLRSQAVSFQADAMFGAWERATAVADREAFEARAKECRTKLTQFVAADNPMLLSIDARIKFMEGDLNAARKLLSDYNEQTGARDALTLQLLAEVLIRQDSIGAAKTNYERVLELEPRNVRALTRLAELAIQDRDYTKAKRYLESAAILAPKDDRIKETLQNVSDLARGADAADPVMRVLNEVRPMTTGVAPDLAGATVKTRDGLRANPGDARLSMLLAELLVAQNDTAGAAEAIRAGLAANPDHGRLKQMEKALADPDPISSQLAAIDQSGLTPLGKHLARNRVLQNAGRAADAAAELDAAAKIDPVDPMVVELLFLRAAEKGDSAEMDRLCDLAESKNLDQARGMVFRARRDLVKLSKEPKSEARRGGMETVATGLRTALAQDRLNAALWRMLGIVQMDLGQFRAASESFTRAVQIRPSDAVSNTSLVKAFVAMGDLDEALKVARRAETVCGADPEFGRMLLMLESDGPGGDREKAANARRRLAVSRPDDLENKLALVSLLLATNKISEAEPIAVELAAKDPRRGTAARSAIQARSGDRDGAVETYRAFLDSNADPKTFGAEYVVASNFIAQIAGREHALKLLESAIEKQSPKDREIDRTIGDLNFDMSEYEKSIQAYERVLAAGVADPEHVVLKRVIEANLRLARFQQAEELIASAGTDAKSDPILLLLSAQAAAGMKNFEGARRALDQAVAAAPDNYLMYFKRAEFTSSDSALNRDTEADLEQALRLKPDLTVARRMLATMYFSSGRMEQGVTEVRKALAATPGDVQLRMDFVELLLALSRQSEALDLAEEAVKTFPDDVAWRVRAAQIFSATGRFDRAAELYGDVFSKVPMADSAELYVVALTSGSNPNPQRAMEVLTTPSLKTNENWRLIMLRARVWTRARGVADAAKNAMADFLLAWSKIDQNNADQAEQFFQLIPSVFEAPADQGAALMQIERRSPFVGWGLLRASLLRLTIPGAEAQAQSSLRQLSEAENLDPVLAAAVWSSVGADAYRRMDFQNALLAFQRALKFTPDSAELNNNVAYTLGVDLKRPTEALPYAENAARVAPSSPMILDTLGALYHAIGRDSEALPILQKAVNLSLTPTERVPSLLHLAATLKGLGDKAQARHFAEIAGQFLAANPALKLHYETELKELIQSLDGE